MSDPGILKSVWITGSRTVIVTVVSVLYTAMFTLRLFPSLSKRKIGFMRQLALQACILAAG